LDTNRLSKLLLFKVWTHGGYDEGNLLVKALLLRETKEDTINHRLIPKNDGPKVQEYEIKEGPSFMLEAL